MKRMEGTLTDAGYEAINIGYPSTRFPIETLAEHILEKINDCVGADTRVHFVTHSMGGILVRYLVEHLQFAQTNRVVMLCPPNQGSEVVDRLGNLKLFQLLNGPAGGQLGTGPNGIATRLGPIDFELAVITGNRSINWILSTMIPGPNDGKVSIESARVHGMKHYKVVPVSHPYIMKNPAVIDDVLSFLESGEFSES